MSARAANSGQPYLGSVQDVEKIVRQLAASVIERFDEVGHGVLTPSDAATADQQECMKLGAAFTGAGNEYALLNGWNGKPLADYLRQQMARDLDPDQSDEVVVAQAFAAFVHGLYDLLRQAGRVDDEALQQSLSGQVRAFSMALLGVMGNE